MAGTGIAVWARNNSWMAGSCGIMRYSVEEDLGRVIRRGDPEYQGPRHTGYEEARVELAGRAAFETQPLARPDEPVANHFGQATAPGNRKAA